MKSNSAPLLILLAAALWGTTGTAQALAPAEAQPLAVGTLRLLLAGAALLAVVFARRAGSALFRLPPGKTLLAAACMAAYQLLFFAGVKATGVAVGTVVGIGSAPLLAGLLGYLFRGERPGARWAAATALALAGCGLLIGARGEMQVNTLGLLLAVGAGAAYATFSLVTQEILQRQPVEVVMAAAFGLGALLLAPLLLTQDVRWLAQPGGIGAIVWLGIMATALAYLLFGAGLRRTQLSTAVTLSLAEPFTAGMLGIFLLREPVNLLGGVGLLLIVSGIVLLSVGTRR